MPSEEELILRAAWMYHFEELTQRDIAQVLQIPRARVIKLLREGQEQGFVTVQLSHKRYNCLERETALKTTFGLSDAVVVPAPQDSESLTSVLGKAAAHYLPKVLRPGMTLGTAWGGTMLEVARHFRPYPLEDASVVMMLGGIPDSLPALNPNDIARLFAEKLSSHNYYLCAPALLERPESRQVLLEDASVHGPMELARASQVALLGAGTCTPSTTLHRVGLVSGPQLAELRAKGAVGDILARYFDRNGTPVRTGLDERVIGLELEDVKRIDMTILVAGGSDKVEAILGALRGGYVNILVTDENTCGAVLEQGTPVLEGAT